MELIPQKSPLIFAIKGNFGMVPYSQVIDLLTRVHSKLWVSSLNRLDDDGEQAVQFWDYSLAW